MKQGIICHYTQAKVAFPVGQKKESQSPTAILTSHGLPGLKSDEIELLHHFHCQTLCTLGSTSVQEAIASCLAAAPEFDFLKHAIFTLAASHLMFLSERRDMSMNAHLDRALLSFRQRLSSPITATEVDAVLTSCVLLNMIAFSNGPHRPLDSWLFTGTADLQWLTAQTGLGAIMSDIRHLLKQSSWARVYMRDAKSFHGQTSAPLDEDNLGSEAIPENLKTFFSISHDSVSSNNVYYSTYRSLAPLLEAGSLDNSLTQLMAVAHRFKTEFYQLLRSRDLRALLLLAYWLGSMCKVHLWWIFSRVLRVAFHRCAVRT